LPAVADRQSVCPCVRRRRRPHRASRCSACAPRGGVPRSDDPRADLAVRAFALDAAECRWRTR